MSKVLINLEEKENRNTISNFLNSQKSCNLTELFSDLKVIVNDEERSNSNSIIILGNVKTQIGIVIKMTYDSSNKYNNSLAVERQIYENVIFKLLDNNHTPHLIAPYSFMKCTSNDFYIDDDNYDIIQINTKSMEEINDEMINLLVLERSNGIQLKYYLMEYGKDIKNNLSIIFEILQCLECCRRKGLRHNDLHFGNIFIENLKEEKFKYYKIGDQIVKLTSSVIAKIYDWELNRNKY